jgi:hypothetical protein
MNSLKEHSEKLNSADEADRIYAAEDIGYLEGAGGVPVLLERLEKENSRAVREAIFQALTRIEADAAIEGCVALLGHDDSQIRNQAAEVLRRKDRASVPFLQAAMRSGDKDVRKMILDVLMGFQAAGTEAIYEAALSDPELNVVITAVENLGKTRSTRFRPQIERLLQSSAHPMLDGACLEALAGIGNERSLQAIQVRFPELGKIPNFFLVSWLKAFGSLGTTREFPEVAGLLTTRGPQLMPAILASLIAIHKRNPEQSQGDVLLPAIRAVAENGDLPLGRYQAVRSLGFLSVREDVYAFLLECLSSSERLVRLAAIESLRMGPRRGLESVFAACALAEKDEEVLQAMS